MKRTNEKPENDFDLWLASRRDPSPRSSEPLTPWIGLSSAIADVDHVALMVGASRRRAWGEAATLASQLAAHWLTTERRVVAVAPSWPANLVRDLLAVAIDDDELEALRDATIFGAESDPVGWTNPSRLTLPDDHVMICISPSTWPKIEGVSPCTLVDRADAPSRRLTFWIATSGEDFSASPTDASRVVCRHGSIAVVSNGRSIDVPSVRFTEGRWHEGEEQEVVQRFIAMPDGSRHVVEQSPRFADDPLAEAEEKALALEESLGENLRRASSESIL